jgi:hypothetical protein
LTQLKCTSTPPHAHTKPEAPGTPLQPASAAEKATDDHSFATIIMAQQHDRLRARCAAIQAGRDSFKRELQQAQADVAESLKADDTKVFEKMRYLQSYNNTNNNNSSCARGGAYSRNNLCDLAFEALVEQREVCYKP